MIHVVNIRKHKPTSSDVYCGRGSVLGNPYTCKDIKKTKAAFQCETREESVENYRNYLLEKIKQKDRAICDELNRIWLMAKQGDVFLVCFCAPKLCHTEIIKEIVESKL